MKFLKMSHGPLKALKKKVDFQENCKWGMKGINFLDTKPKKLKSYKFGLKSQSDFSYRGGVYFFKVLGFQRDHLHSLGLVMPNTKPKTKNLIPWKKKLRQTLKVRKIERIQQEILAYVFDYKIQIFYKTFIKLCLKCSTSHNFVV